MAEQHRATPEQWALVGRMAHHVEFSTILELRDRIEALEASQSGSIDLSHLSDAEREKILKQIANPDRFEVMEVAQPAKPDSSLVERVAFAIIGDSDELINWKPEARAAIREVVAWLLKHYGGPTATTYLLEEEAER